MTGAGGHRRTLSYIPALDGLRAIAVLAVIGYHVGVPWLRGGFLGVDAFFVLSGYLITSLLLTEWERTGTIALRAFWARRARRLLPALLLLLVGIVAYETFVAAPGELASVRGDVVGTLAYVANWRFVLAHQGYFARLASPSPLRHAWSLAIEEQFYLVWPLAVLVVVRLRRSRRAVLAVASSGAVCSALVMAALYRAGHDPSRVYYGTDTRAQAILIGAALAAAAVGAWRARRTLRLATVAAAAMCLWAFARVGGEDVRLYRGGSTLIALCVAALIAGVVTAPDAAVSRVLATRPLVAVGRISYGLYLWHWPVTLVATHARTGLTGLPLLALRVALTFALAVASYHLVERPVRERRVRLPTRLGTAPVAIGLAATCLLLVAVPSVRRPAVALAASANAGTSATGVTHAMSTVPRVRVLLLGDSVALTLGEGLQAREAPFGVQLLDEGVLGCGILHGDAVRDAGVVHGEASYCADLVGRWQARLRADDPDVIALLIGRWDLMDHAVGGRWLHLGDASYDAAFAANLDRAVTALIVGRAPLVLMTEPYYRHGERPDGRPWPEDDPARVDRLNALLRREAARHPGRVSVVDLGALLSPGHRFVGTVGGVVTRRDDGVHVTLAGGELVAPMIFPKLSALAGPGALRPARA